MEYYINPEKNQQINMVKTCFSATIPNVVRNRLTKAPKFPWCAFYLEQQLYIFVYNSYFVNYVCVFSRYLNDMSRQKRLKCPERCSVKDCQHFIPSERMKCFAMLIPVNKNEMNRALGHLCAHIG